MKYVLMGLLLGVGFFCGCHSTQSTAKAGYDFTQIDKVAVLDVTGKLKSEAAKNQIADFFTMELLKKGYSPIERMQVQTILKEQQFQASEETSTEEAVKAGRIVNVPVVMLINIPNFTEEMSMTAKLINVQDGTVLWMSSGEGTTGRTLATILGAAGGAGAGVAVGGDDSSGKVVGGIIGGVIGGVAARALTPQEAKKAQEITRRMCVNLPSKVSCK